MKLKHSEVRLLDDAFDMHGGYVLDFSDRTIAEFFGDEFGSDFYDQRYAFNGTSKAKRLRAFVSAEDAFTVSRVLRKLWKFRESLPRYQEAEDLPDNVERRFFALLERIEGGGEIPRTDAIERFKQDETIEELISAIERDIGANKPAAALDRLHTYCMKKFGHLLDERGITWDRNDRLQSRVGKYVKALEQERDLRDITRRVIKSSISVFEALNDVRNNKSFAHDNDLIDQAEARFIFDAVSAFLRFLKAVDTSRFGV